MSIKMVRLSSGEEIICQYRKDKDVNGSIHILTEAAILFPVGEGKLAFAKWMTYVSEEQHKSGIVVDDKFVMFVVDVEQEMKKQYQSMISGLIVPSKGPVTGAGLKLTT